MAFFSYQVSLVLVEDLKEDAGENLTTDKAEGEHTAVRNTNQYYY